MYFCGPKTIFLINKTAKKHTCIGLLNLIKLQKYVIFACPEDVNHSYFNHCKENLVYWGSFSLSLPVVLKLSSFIQEDRKGVHSPLSSSPHSSARSKG